MQYKHFIDFIKVYFFLFLFSALIAIYIDELDLIINTDSFVNYLLKDLSFQKFITEYLNSIVLFAINVIIILIFSIAFSVILNFWVTSFPSPLNKTLFTLEYIYKVFNFKWIFLSVRFGLFFAFFNWVVFNESPEYTRNYLCLLYILYISITIFGFIEKEIIFKNTNKYHLILILAGPSIFSLAIFIIFYVNTKSIYMFQFGAFSLVLYEFTLFSIIIIGKLIKIDLSYATAVKNKIMNEGLNNAIISEKLSNIIIIRNRQNLLISIYLILSLILSIFIFWFFYYFLNIDFEHLNLTQFKKFLLAFSLIILTRFVSRSYEIIIAFVRDITDKKSKKSSLDGKDRMILAIKSLIEITVTVAVIRASFELYLIVHELYYCNSLSCSPEQTIIIEPVSFLGFIAKNLFISIATMGFNISFPDNEKIIYQFIHIIQLIVSMSLITLSITTYISFDSEGKKKSDEKAE
ncbi:hypothetical protein BLX88_00475 [Bacillus obstructivus]|nr:hypothetical protein BLX88_00475 [Bacillus obstructivus]